MRSVGWLGNDDGRVIFSTPTQTPTQGLCFVRGLDLLQKTVDILGNTERGVVCPIQSIGCRPAVGLSFSKDHMPRGSPVPNCRDGLGEILTQRGAWAQLASASTNDVPQCMAKVRAIIHSQPASRQPAQPTETEAGGFLPPAYASQPVSHVVARVRYRQGRRPLQITRVVSLLWGASIAPLRDRTRQRPVQLELTALLVRSTLMEAGECGCAVDAIRYHSVLYLLRRISIATQLSSTPKRCSGSSGMRGSIESVEQ